jgi:hypothetical protein
MRLAPQGWREKQSVVQKSDKEEQSSKDEQGNVAVFSAFSPYFLRR